MTTATSETKFIKYGDKEFPLGDMTLEQAKQIMARHFPELADPEVKTETKDGKTTYALTKKAGKKGARRAVPTAPIQHALRKLKPDQATLDNALSLTRMLQNGMSEGALRMERWSMGSMLAEKAARVQEFQSSLSHTPMLPQIAQDILL